MKNGKGIGKDLFQQY